MRQSTFFDMKSKFVWHFIEEWLICKCVDLARVRVCACAVVSCCVLNIASSLCCESVRQSLTPPPHTQTLIRSDWFPSPLMFSQLKFMGTWGGSRYHSALASFSLPFKVLPSLPLQVLKRTLQMLKTSIIRQHLPPPKHHESFSWLPGPLAEGCGHFL